MVRKPHELEVTVNKNMRDGEGEVIIQHLASQSEMNEKNRLFARIVLKPKCSVGYHVHENEMEAYYIISGKALYDDNGKEIEISAGDVTITPSGHGHAITNNGTEDLVFIALIPV